MKNIALLMMLTLCATQASASRVTHRTSSGFDLEWSAEIQIGTQGQLSRAWVRFDRFGANKVASLNWPHLADAGTFELVDEYTVTAAIDEFELTIDFADPLIWRGYDYYPDYRNDATGALSVSGGDPVYTDSNVYRYLVPVPSLAGLILIALFYIRQVTKR